MGPSLSATRQSLAKTSMGDHIDNRKGVKHKKRKMGEGVDPALARRRRVTFKNYLREVEEELLEADLETQEEDLNPKED